MLKLLAFLSTIYLSKQFTIINSSLICYCNINGDNMTSIFIQPPPELVQLEIEVKTYTYYVLIIIPSFYAIYFMIKFIRNHNYFQECYDLSVFSYLNTDKDKHAKKNFYLVCFSGFFYYVPPAIFNRLYANFRQDYIFVYLQFLFDAIFVGL